MATMKPGISFNKLIQQSIIGALLQNFIVNKVLDSKYIQYLLVMCAPDQLGPIII